MGQSFDFISGWHCLDFANAFAAPAPTGGIAGYAALLDWSEQARALHAAEARRLRGLASREPDRAAAVVDRAGRLAAALERIFGAISDAHRPTNADLAVLNAELATALGKLAIVAGEKNTFAVDWPATGDDLDQVLWPIARAAADLLVSPELGRLKSCDAPTCSYLFVDASKPGRRRWCDMKVCGNRHKARRHRKKRRRRGGAGTPDGKTDT